MPGNKVIQYSQSKNSPSAQFVSKTLRDTARFRVGVTTLLLDAREKITEIVHRGPEILPRKLYARHECQLLGTSSLGTRDSWGSGPAHG